VNCDYAVQKLLEKELIEIKGKSDAPGKPLVYVTSKTFMDYFGIRNVKDLPQLKDLHVDQNEIGQPSEYAEETEETFIADTTTGSEIVIVEEINGIKEPVNTAELPDRKAIFLGHEKKSDDQDGISFENNEENSYDEPRD
jgi:hypothetical protein